MIKQNTNTKWLQQTLDAKEQLGISWTELCNKNWMKVLNKKWQNWEEIKWQQDMTKSKVLQFYPNTKLKGKGWHIEKSVGSSMMTRMRIGDFNNILSQNKTCKICKNKY